MDRDDSTLIGLAVTGAIILIVGAVWLLSPPARPALAGLDAANQGRGGGSETAGFQPVPISPSLAENQQRHMVEFEVRDAATDQRIEASVSVQVIGDPSNDGVSLPGERDGLTIGFDGRPGVRYTAVACTRSDEGETSSLFTCFPQSSRVIELRVHRRRLLTVRVPNANPAIPARVLAVPLAPPLWPRSWPHMETSQLKAGMCSLHLLPGDYGVLVYESHSPEKTAIESRAELGKTVPVITLSLATENGTIIDAPGRQGLATVRIGEGGQMLELPFGSAEPGVTLNGTAVDAHGDADSGAQIEAFLPGPAHLRRRVASTAAGARGEFTLPGLPVGDIQLRSSGVRGSSSKWLTLSDAPVDVRLVATPRLPKGFIRYTGQAVSSVKVLCAGKPVPGATLTSVAGGRLEAWSSDTRSHRFGGPADVEGVIRPDGVEDGDCIVEVRPYCGEVFEIPFSSESTGQAIIEISPPDTGTLRFHYSRPSPAFRCLNISREGSFSHFPTQAWGREETNEIVVFGLRAGEYRVEGDDQSDVHRTLRVTVAANETVTLDDPFPTRRIACPKPAPYQRAKQEWPRIAILAESFEGPYWRELHELRPRPDSTGFAFDAAPTDRLRLTALVQGRLCTAMIPPGEQDVSAVDWYPFRTGQAGDGGTLVVRVPRKVIGDARGKPVRDEHEIPLRIEIRGGPMDWVEIETDQPPRVAEDFVEYVFSRILPGCWQVRATRHWGRRAVRDLHDVTVEPGRSVLVRASPLVKISVRPEPPPVLAPDPTIPLSRAESGAPVPEGHHSPVEIHAWGAPLEALWQAELRYMDYHLNERIGVHDGSRCSRLEMTQRQGRPIFMWNGGAGALDMAELCVPGCKPVPIDFPPGARHVAVTLERE